MFVTRWKFALALAIGVASVAPGPSAAQQPDRRPDNPEVRGVVRSVDTARNSITVAVTARDRESVEKTFTLGKDAEVLLDDGRGRRFLLSEGKLADLHPGTLVALTPSSDGKTIETVIAEGPTAQGVVKSLDAEKGTITLTLQPRGRGEDGEEKTYALNKQTEVVIDDGRGRRTSFKEGKPADLKPGSIASVKLSLDQKTAQSITAEGPNVFGPVKAVDATAGTITLLQGRGDEAAEKTFTVATDADVLLDDGRGRRFFSKPGKLADLREGALAGLKLSLDQKTVVMIRAEGPTVYGTLKKVDADKGTVTLLVGAGRGSDGTEKTFTLAKGAKALYHGREVKPSELKVNDGALVGLRLSLDQKTVKALVVPRE